VAVHADKLVEVPERQAARQDHHQPQRRYGMSNVSLRTSTPERPLMTAEFAPTPALVVDPSEITIDHREGAYGLGIDEADFLLDEAPEALMDETGVAAAAELKEDGRGTSPLSEPESRTLPATAQASPPPRATPGADDVSLRSSPAEFSGLYTLPANFSPTGYLPDTPHPDGPQEDEMPPPPGPQLNLIPPTPEHSQEQVVPVAGRGDGSTGTPDIQDPPLLPGQTPDSAASTPPLDQVQKSASPPLLAPPQRPRRLRTPPLEVPDTVGARTRSQSRSPSATPQKRGTESGDEPGGKKRRVGRGL
jgi:hypothetical protein